MGGGGGGGGDEVGINSVTDGTRTTQLPQRPRF